MSEKCRYYKKILEDENPMRLSPFDRHKPYKEGKRGGLTSKQRN